jgi:hypothetical protein
MGNLFTSLVNFFIAGRLPGVKYYLFFSGCITLTAVAFILIARIYQPRTYLQAGPLAEPAPT